MTINCVVKKTKKTKKQTKKTKKKKRQNKKINLESSCDEKFS